MLIFHFFFIYSAMKKKRVIHMPWITRTKIPLIVIHTLCTLVVLVQYIVHYSISQTMQKIISHKLLGIYALTPTNYTPLGFLYLTFAMTIFVKHYMSHVDGSSSVTSHVSMNCIICINSRTHIFKRSLTQWFSFHQWSPLPMTSISSVFFIFPHFSLVSSCIIMVLLFLDQVLTLP